MAQAASESLLILQVSLILYCICSYDMHAFNEMTCIVNQ